MKISHKMSIKIANSYHQKQNKKISNIWNGNNRSNKNFQPLEIMNEKWQILFVLDACRYDCFKEVYKQILGKDYKLEKRLSLASCTLDWLKRNFPRYYEDVVYISSNPFVSRTTIYDNWKADEHFHKIYLVGHQPAEVNKAFMKAILRYPKKRFILHYLPPHAHFTRIPDYGFGVEFLKPKTWFIPTFIRWDLKKFFRIKPFSNMELYYRMYGFSGFREAYKGEIRYALKYIKRITDSIDTDVLITADHGERLGEWWRYGHNSKLCKPLIEIPYCKKAS